LATDNFSYLQIKKWKWYHSANQPPVNDYTVFHNNVSEY